MTPEEINRIIVEKGEGGCWHECDEHYTRPICVKCGKNEYANPNFSLDRPDFSKWKNFGRLLKVAEKYAIKVMVEQKHVKIYKTYGFFNTDTFFDGEPENIDQIPSLVAAELARVLEEKK